MRQAGRPRHTAGILSQRVAQKLVLLNPRTGAYYSLDDIGARLWELCDGSRTISDAIAAICAEYDADPATVETDVLSLLDELTREDLVEVHTGA
jgi:Coenzyme PQQ synthesis protein D (PqqD)